MTLCNGRHASLASGKIESFPISKPHHFGSIFVRSFSIGRCRQGVAGLWPPPAVRVEVGYSAYPRLGSTASVPAGRGEDELVGCCCVREAAAAASAAAGGEGGGDEALRRHINE